MKCDVMRIFDINNTVLNDKSIGPVTSMCHNEMIFGFTPIEHKGHFGREYTKKHSFSQELNNVYICDFNDVNHGKDVVDFYKNECKKNWTQNVIPVWNQLFDILQENVCVRQSELARMMGFPANLSNDNSQRDRMIAEFIANGVESAALDTYKDGSKRIVELLDRDKIPIPSYNFTRHNKSKNEAYIFGIMDDLTKQSPSNLTLKWGLALSKWKNAPYDIAVMRDKEIVGLVEVDGEQHNKRIDYFFKTEKDWENRQRIDREKTQLAADEDIPLFRITESYLKKTNKNETIRIIRSWLNTLT